MSSSAQSRNMSLPDQGSEHGCTNGDAGSIASTLVSSARKDSSLLLSPKSVPFAITTASTVMSSGGAPSTAGKLTNVSAVRLGSSAHCAQDASHCEKNSANASG